MLFRSGLLAGQLRFLYQIDYYRKEGKSSKEIMELCNIPDYRLSKADEALTHINGKQILSLLKKLSDLDILCKTDSTISDKTRFELFILEFLK